MLGVNLSAKISTRSGGYPLEQTKRLVLVAAVRVIPALPAAGLLVPDLLIPASSSRGHSYPGEPVIRLTLLPQALPPGHSEFHDPLEPAVCRQLTTLKLATV